MRDMLHFKSLVRWDWELEPWYLEPNFYFIFAGHNGVIQEVSLITKKGIETKSYEGVRGKFICLPSVFSTQLIFFRSVKQLN